MLTAWSKFLIDSSIFFIWEIPLIFFRWRDYQKSIKILEARRRQDNRNFYRYCHAEEEERVCDRGRQSEIYARPDVVSASLIRATVVTTVRGIKCRRIAGFREMRERACVFFWTVEFIGAWKSSVEWWNICAGLTIVRTSRQGDRFLLFFLLPYFLHSLARFYYDQT